MSEAGHAKNVANFETLTNIVNALDGTYQPTSPMILPAGLQTVLADSKAAVTAVGAKDSASTNAGKLRAQAFDGHEKLATRVGNAYAAGDTDELVSSNLTGLIRKLRGRRAGEKPAPVPNAEGGDPIDKSHSVSQQSYDNLIANWRLIIQLLETQAGYKPNEEDLTIAALKTFVDNLDAKNNAAKIAVIDAKNARADRNRILYDDETGMLTAVRKVKKYVSTLKNAGAAYEQLVALKFRKVR
jgi:hypothetical protein